MSRGAGAAFCIEYLCKLLCCQCNQINTFDHATFLASIIVTSHVLLFVYALNFFESLTASDHGPASPGEIFLAINYVLGLMTGLYAFIWYLGECVVRRGLSNKSLIAPPVLGAAINAMTWYALVIYLLATSCELWGKDGELWGKDGLGWFLLIPVVLGTVFVYVLRQLKMEYASSDNAVGTPEEPLASSRYNVREDQAVEIV